MSAKLVFEQVSFDRFTSESGRAKEGTTRVLHSISFGARTGEVLVIAGPSGSGKSTLLRLANRLFIPTEGTVTLDGTDVSELPVTQLRRRVGLVQQIPALFEGSVIDNVMFGPRLHGTSDGDGDERARAREVLTLAGLSETFLDRDANELSEGEKQRVALARILANNPEVLLLDEPTASLDPSATALVEKQVVALASRTNLAILFVTHDVEQAKRLGTRGILLVDGRKVDDGPLPEMFARPSNEQTGAFVKGQL